MTATETTELRVDFGTELLLDLGGCDTRVIRDSRELVTIVQLCAEKIGMAMHGQPLVQHFGQSEVAGWTVVQLITTSNINVHAVDGDNSAFVNVFSCRPFDTDLAAAFLVDCFGAAAHTATVVTRRVPTRTT